MRSRNCWLACLWFLWISPAKAQDVTQINPPADRKAVELTVTDADLKTMGGGVFWEARINPPKARYSRISIDGGNSNVSSFKILVIDIGSGVQVTTLDSERLKDTPFLSGLLPGRPLLLRLSAANQPRGVHFTIKAILSPPQAFVAHPQSALIKLNFVSDEHNNQLIQKIARSVPILHIGPADITCTGALVAPDTIVTNFHCLKYSLQYQRSKDAPQQNCGDILAEFDFLDKTKSGPTIECQKSTASESLDLAVLTFDFASSNGVGSREPILLRASSDAPRSLAIVHYPLGLPEAYELNCGYHGDDGKDILHDCVTTSGSSGSPVFDEEFRLVGIHYQGPYPSDWTQERAEMDYMENGPKYNRARSLTALKQMLGR